MLDTLESIGSYRLLDVLGRGGMGVVYRAQHQDTGAIVALKTVQVQRPRDLQGIRREIGGLGRLAHPGIVRILDEGLWQGAPWYAMELLSGLPLRRWMGGDPTSGRSSSGASTPESDPLPWWSESLTTAPPSDAPAKHGLGPPMFAATTRIDVGAEVLRSALDVHGLGAVLRLVRRLCAPLAFLHAQGMVHRDLKPENILIVAASGEQRAASSDSSGGRTPSLAAGSSQIGASPWPVLVDFGLSASSSTADGRDELSVEGSRQGTVQYMAPEQIRGEACDGRTDLYALGCVFYELLCGHPPFASRSAAEVLSCHLMQAPPRPSREVEQVDSRIDDLVMGLLEKNPRHRLGYAVSLAAALEELAGEPDEPRIWPGARPHLFRPALVGRSEDRRRLRECVRLDGTSGSFVLLVGESGVGKTRLMSELGTELAVGKATVLTGACLAIGGEPLQPLRGALQAIADLCREQGPEWAQRIVGWGAPILAMYEPRFSDFAPEAGANLRQPSTSLPMATPALLFVHLSRLLAQLATIRPVVLVLDDLQWADELTLGWLEWLVEQRWFERERCFVVGALRSGECGERMGRLSLEQGVARVELDRLNADQVGEMAAAMLAVPAVPRPFAQTVARFSDGNPLFVAEYLRAAVDRGLVRLDAKGRWQTDLLVEHSTTQSELSLPSSLRELLGRRLMGLSDQADRMLAAAAVFGRAADASTLGHIAGVSATQLESAVGELLRREVLAETETGRLRFAHDRLRDVVFERIGEEERRQLHARVARALESMLETEGEGVLGDLAMHLELSGQIERASAISLRAARWALERCAMEDAERLYQACIRSLVTLSQPAIEVRNELAIRFYRRLGRMESARGEIECALAEARALGDRPREAQSLLHLGLVLLETGHASQAQQLYLDATSLARDLQDKRLEASSMSQLATLLRTRGQYLEAQQHLEKAQEICHQHRLEDLETTLLDNLAALHHNQGLLDVAEGYYQQTLERHRQAGDTGSEGSTLSNLAALRRWQGRLDEARGLHQEALRIHRRRGDVRGEAIVLTNLVQVERDADRLIEAERLCRDALILLRQMGQRRIEALVLAALADTQTRQGKIEEARTLLQQSLQLRLNLEDYALAIPLLLDLGELARLTGASLDEAHRQLDEAWKLLERHPEPAANRGMWLCQRGLLEIAETGSAQRWLRELQDSGLFAAGAPPTELQHTHDTLLKAQAAVDAGRSEELHRGETLKDLPLGLRLWLVQNGRVSREGAGVSSPMPATTESVPLKLDWD